MTISHATGTIPEWTKGDRLAKALKSAGVSVQDMADYLGVSRQTVGNYVSGRTQLTRGDMRLWAMRCGVPLEWLETGERPEPKSGPGLSLLPQMDSNHQPFDYRSRDADDYRSRVIPLPQRRASFLPAASTTTVAGTASPALAA